MPARGRHPHNKLTDVTARQALPGRHADGLGLYLFVRPSTARQWVQRITIDSRRRDLGLGPYPVVSLAEARRIALDNRRVVRAGGDPTREAARKKGPTFRQLYEVVTENRRTNWKRTTTEASWRRLFEKHVFPVIGDKPVRAVTIDDVRRMVVPYWSGRNSRGYILRQNLEAVFDWAVAEKYRSDNPAAQLKRLLPQVTGVENHQPSLPYTEAPEAMAQWQQLPVNPAIKLVVLFIVLTGSRLTEATGATWQEIDLVKCCWTVPADRMKPGCEHKVPLSRQAVELLDRAKKELRPHVSLVFPLWGPPDGKPRPVSQGALSDALQKLGRVDAEGRRIVVHGFRSTFRVWVSEAVKGRSKAAEAALSHYESNKTKKAYARSKLYKPRVPLMQAWADYVLPASVGAGAR